MTDPSTDQIRDLLAGEMSAAPEPHPWAEVERRARLRDDVAPPARPRIGIWLAVAACAIALVGGLVLVVGAADEPTTPADDPDGPPPSTASPTSVPRPTTPTELESGWTGGLLDDLDTEALRPLDSFTAGDAIVPTAPGGWRVVDFARPQDAASQWYVEVVEALPDGSPGRAVNLTTQRDAYCPATECRPSGDPVTINGVEWEAIALPGTDPEVFDVYYLSARVGDRWVDILAVDGPALLSGPLLENPLVVEYLEGLRAGSPEVVETIGEACFECAEFGKGGDPFAQASGDGTDAAQSDGDPTTSQGPGEDPSGADSDIGRPLTELAAGDVIVPTYIPPGLTLKDSVQFHEYPGGTSEVSVSLETADNDWANSVRLWEYVNDSGPLGPGALDDPNHPPVEIAGLTWGWNDFETARVTNIGQFSVWLYLHGLDRPEAEKFIDGLRAIPIDAFPGQVTP